MKTRSMIGTLERTPPAPSWPISEWGGVQFESQSQWRVLILVAFFTGGLGCGLYAASWLLDFRPGLILGLLLVGVVKGGAHVAYLGRPERFWRALARPQTSWISRGLIGMAVFLTAGSLYAAFGWPLLGGLAVAAALFVMAYTGYLMAFSPSIPLWNSALLPVLFLVYSAKSGIAVALPLHASFAGAEADVARALAVVEILLLGAVGVILYSYLYGAYHSSLPARAAVRLLVRGRLAPLFFVAVVLLGLAVPLPLALWSHFGEGPAALAWVVALLSVQGALFFRWAILRAGVYAPLRH
jgi:formate-dependent nitrite reductase membrane component NrfD